MFTGIIEAKAKALKVIKGDRAIQIHLERPSQFNDLHIGDSIAVNGVCLTVEAFDEKAMQFTIGFETLNVTHWQVDDLQNTAFNLERSLRFGDRIHGHMVSGHVDSISTVTYREQVGECLLLNFRLPEDSRTIWQKSSVAINGVSLTVNWVKDGEFQVCLVPETLRKTHLEGLGVGDSVNLESDYYMKGLLNAQRIENAQRS